MAEFLDQAKPEASGMDAIGKPISYGRRQRGFDNARDMGLDSGKSWEVVQVVSEMLERDKPYEAMSAGCRYLDLTGTYRLFAVRPCLDARAS